MTRVRASLFDYKQPVTTDSTREGHERTFGNQDKSWCPHCGKVLKKGDPTCQWCGEKIEGDACHGK